MRMNPAKRYLQQGCAAWLCAAARPQGMAIATGSGLATGTGTGGAVRRLWEVPIT